MKATAWFAGRSPWERSIFVLYAARATLGWLVALPLIRAVGASGVAKLPAGDASLFQEGALWLLELLRTHGPALRSALATSIVSGLVALAVLCVPSALLFASAPRALERAPAWPRALAIAPRFLALGVLEALAVGGLMLLIAAASGAVETSAARFFDERGRDIATWVFCAPGLLAVGLALIVADVARAGLVRDRRVLPAVTWAIAHVRDATAPLVGGFVAASGISILLIALAARATDLCRVALPGGARVALVLALHQGVLVGLVLIQAWWVRRIDGTLTLAPQGDDQVR